MKQEILLRVENLNKVFTIGSIFSRVRIRAVNNVNFEIGNSEIFTLAGESGSGKTTVAKIILGFLEPTSGKILYKGKDISELQKDRAKDLLRKEVQAVFQNPFETFNPLRRVSNYLMETVKNFGISERPEEVIESALNLVGLTWNEVKDKYPSEFSGGQLQRISIARSLLTNPTLLVADEPVSMVDASLRMSIVNLFKDLKEKRGVSVLYITHDLATAYYVSDRIAIMFRGEIVEIGSVEKVLMDPKHPYTMLLKESIPEPDPKKKWTKDIKILTLEEEEYQMKGCKFISRCPYRMEKCKNPVPDVEVDDRLVKCYLYT
ncbi:MULTISPECIES: ABC transporter ATP-binding protein [Dictyoglomus]|uniref:Oligopeptide/dipeptide ABC transporter, ATPase subunit n=1 Tax=Dictyoglomus turgidum (strain DSM 6724 / Z-1310) TaxID=515635 RepID=B8E3B7_DICTD|nr:MULTISPECIES: ABC transporter ATP-binding protein [Dictyoglomus]ACK42991.1 oligopeptide/dipeptide ABC transporter, ATPase subunit [Dictyoglomus turgidum DSM 6724]PNV78857.1 MAG: ABC transporter ATP-binding protein [Dictyoglomus turgidum]HBU31056.1 ABC transporter ATP-binding protein [Dictyoglomus sp.]